MPWIQHFTISVFVDFYSSLSVCLSRYGPRPPSGLFLPFYLFLSLISIYLSVYLSSILHCLSNQSLYYSCFNIYRSPLPSIPPSLPLPLTFSPVVAKGALNHCSKVEHDLKMEGSRKLRSAHNSGSLFCSGVPVSSRRCGAL